MEKDWTNGQPAVFSASERKTAHEEGYRRGSAKEPFLVQPPAAPAPAAAPLFPAAEKAPDVPAAHKHSRSASRLTTVLAVIFLGGIGYGAVLSGMLDGDTAAALEQMAHGYLAGRAESDFWRVFLRALSSSLMLGGAVFLSGFSAVGQPFAVFFLFFRAIGLGMSMGYFYTMLDGEGILLALLLLLPAGALSGYALLLACREALRLSGRFFAAMTRSAVLPPQLFRIYAVKFLIIALILAAAALLDAGCTRLSLAFWQN